MSKIILVRHGESNFNKEKKFFGWLNPLLTDDGLDSVKNLVNKIEDYDYIFSSPLKRALDSARILNYKNLPISTTDSLKEINFGIFEGLTYSEITQKYPNETTLWINDGINFNYISGESLLNLRDRVISFVESIKNTNKTYLIVTHFGVINVILAHYISDNINSFWKFKSELASITTIEFHDNYPTLLSFSIK